MLSGSMHKMFERIEGEGLINARKSNETRESGYLMSPTI